MLPKFCYIVRIVIGLGPVGSSTGIMFVKVSHFALIHAFELTSTLIF